MPKALTPKTLIPKTFPKDINPKDIDPKDSDLMLEFEKGMDEDRKREMLCHWDAALCHMTLLMRWLRHHLLDPDQE